MNAKLQKRKADLPRIDNEAATDAERQRYLALLGCEVKPPQHGGLIYHLQHGLRLKVLMATDIGSALKEACSLI